MKFSEINRAISQSKYYPFAPLQNKRRLLDVTGRYQDSVDTLFGTYSSNNDPQQFGVLDYLTFGIIPLIRRWAALKNLYAFLKILKKGIAFVLAIPLMILVIVIDPLLEIFLTILYHGS